RDRGHPRRRHVPLLASGHRPPGRSGLRAAGRSARGGGGSARHPRGPGTRRPGVFPLMGAETSPPLTHRMVRFLGHGGGVAYYLIAGMLALTAVSSALFAHVFGLKLRRDVARLVLEDNGDVLEGLQWVLSATGQATQEAQQRAV